MLEFNGTTIVIAISFIIFVILENLVFFKPMKKAVDERNSYISGNEKEAEKNIAEAKTLIEEKDNKIASAKNQSSQMLNKASLESQEKLDTAIKEAKLNSNLQIEEIKKNLETEKVNAQNELKKDIASYSAAIISKILGKDISMVNVNEEIIDKAMRGEL